MAIRKLILTFALAAFVLPSWTLASDEHRATVLLRNGDRVAGNLEDVEGGVVYVRVSLHDQRRLGIGDVALIDFVGGASGLPDTEISAARGPEHLALLRGVDESRREPRGMEKAPEVVPRVREVSGLRVRVTPGIDAAEDACQLGRENVGDSALGDGVHLLIVRPQSFGLARAAAASKRRRRCSGGYRRV